MNSAVKNWFDSKRFLYHPESIEGRHGGDTMLAAIVQSSAQHQVVEFHWELENPSEK